jgi:hypothetical protein
MAASGGREAGIEALNARTDELLAMQSQADDAGR